IPQEQLHRPEPELEEPGDAVLGPVREIGVARVARDALLLRPTEQLVDRPLQKLALQVPERVVDRADRVAGQPGRPVWGRRAAHQVPQLLGRDAILADEDLSEVAVDDLLHWPGVVREADAPGAVV